MAVRVIPRYAGEQLSFDTSGVLFFGDNLEVLRRHVADECVDLIYLDPPFNSKKTYNMLFQHKDGTEAAGQRKAFDDMWSWDPESRRVYSEIVAGGGAPSDMIRGLHTAIGPTDMLAYVTMMTPRLIELRRVLKRTGTVYLHCDPNVSHYLKVMLDAVFGPENYRNEIVWRRTIAKGGQMGRLPANHDVVFAYVKSADATWNEIRVPYDLDNLDEKTLSKYSHQDSDGRRYQLDNLLHPEQGRRPNLDYEVMGVRRTWRWSKERMEEAIADGLVVQAGPGRVPRQKRYLDEQKGRLVDDVWIDINPLNSQAAERLGYPTQKPVALLERIIEASSNEGDLVLDPFCGCGTTIDAAHRLGRKWIGIDVTRVAIEVIQERLTEQFGDLEYAMGGEPGTVEEAAALADLDKIEFQRWACEQIGAKPGGRGGDRGIDGRIVGTFEDGSWTALISVKGGKKVTPTELRDLHGTVTNAGAYIGIFLSLNKPSKQMVNYAADAGFTDTGEPVLQLLTVEDLFDGKRPELPKRVVPIPVQERWLKAV